jgi:hypothetical protein
MFSVMTWPCTLSFPNPCSYPHLVFRTSCQPCVFTHQLPFDYEQFLYFSPLYQLPLTTFDFDTFPLARTRYRFQMYKRTHISVQWECQISPVLSFLHSSSMNLLITQVRSKHQRHLGNLRVHVHSSTSRLILVSLSATLLTSLFLSDLTSCVDLFKSDNAIPLPCSIASQPFVFRHSPLPCHDFSPSLAPTLGMPSPFPPSSTRSHVHSVASGNSPPTILPPLQSPSLSHEFSRMSLQARSTKMAD